MSYWRGPRRFATVCVRRCTGSQETQENFDIVFDCAVKRRRQPLRTRSCPKYDWESARGSLSGEQLQREFEPTGHWSDDCRYLTISCNGSHCFPPYVSAYFSGGF